MKKYMLGGLAALVLVAVPGLSLAEDLKFNLVNNSARSVKNFYTSPSNADNWQEDVLGEDMMAPGETDEITIADGSDQCVYDMKFIMEDGAQLIDNGVDLCKLGSYTLSDAK